MSSRMTRIGGWVVAGATGAALIWVAGSFLQFVRTSPTFTESVTVEPQGYFFRFKASYTHGEEKIDFDYVAVCGYRTTVYKGGGKSNDGTYDPKVMVRATSDGGALMIRTPRACKGQTSANGQAPTDLLPFVVWFDDVNDLTFGFGYASPDAYDSPNAQVQFHGATIERATREEWQAWRDKAEAEYEPKGMLPGPWGYSYPARRAGEPEQPPGTRIARNCSGYVRLKLPEELRPQIHEMWPTSRPKYWVQPPINWMPYDRHRLPDGTERRVMYQNGHDYFKFRRAVGEGEVGVPTYDGGGTVLYWKAHYAADTFPILPRSGSMDPVPAASVESYPRRLVVNEEMKGFVACGGDEPVDRIEDFDLLFLKKKHPIYVNDDLVVEYYSPLASPNIIYEQDEYIFDVHAWPNSM